jgi:hypothetical protein
VQRHLHPEDERTGGAKERRSGRSGSTRYVFEAVRSSIRSLTSSLTASLAIEADHLGFLKGVLGGMISEASHSMVNPGTAPEDVRQQAFALTSQRLQQNVAMNSDLPFRHGLGQQVKDARSQFINVGGRLMDPKEFKKIQQQIQDDEELAQLLQQEEDVSIEDPSAFAEAPVLDPSAAEAPIVDETSHRARRNGLSNRPVSDNDKLKARGVLVSAGMNTSKGRRRIDFHPPSYALPLSAAARQASVQTPMRSRSPVPSGRCATEQAPIDATEQVPHLPVAQLPSQVAEPVLSPHARLRATKNKISERLLDELQSRLIDQIQVDQGLRRLYKRLFDGSSSFGHIVAFVGNQLKKGVSPEAMQGDDVLDKLQDHLNTALFPSPSK